MRRLALVSLAVLAGCGSKAGVAIELTHRLDIFLLEDVSACAVGNPCSSVDPTECFRFEDDAGPVPGLLFDRASLQVVPQRLAGSVSATMQHCFHATLDAALIQQTRADAMELRRKVRELTDGDIELDVQLHEIPSADLPYSVWGTGIWVGAVNVGAQLVPQMSVDTDFMMVVQGDRDPATGYRFARPGSSSCIYLNWTYSGLGVPEYTYLLLPCERHFQKMLYGWIDSLRHAQHEVMGIQDELYANRSYPACGQGDADPTKWFPYPGDCDDPCSPSCGSGDCASDEHLSHVLSAHWKRGRDLVGNYCRNGRQDSDETGVDRGGACSRLGP